MQNTNLTEEQKQRNREQAAYDLFKQLIAVLIEGGNSNNVQNQNT